MAFIRKGKTCPDAVIILKSLSLNYIITYAYVKMIFPEDCFQIRMNCSNHFFYKINIKQ